MLGALGTTAADPSVTATADAVAGPSFEATANEIDGLARTDLPAVLRRLQRRSDEAAGRLRRTFERRPLPWGNRLVRAVASRVGLLGDESYNEDQERLESLVRALELRITQFMHHSATLGSPTEYQEDLRDARTTLAQLLEDHSGATEVSAETFKTLSNIIDLVELTRRDIERRLLDRTAIALQFSLAHLAAADEAAVTEILGADATKRATWEQSALLEPSELQRLQDVAQLLYDLRNSYTSEGLAEWFFKSFRQLDESRPVDLLSGDEAARGRLRSYARSLRSQAAS